MQSVFSKIEDGLSELSTIMAETLNAFQTHVLKEFDIISLNESSLEELRNRARVIKHLSGDRRVEAFIDNVEKLSLSTSSFQHLASMLVSKPAKLWIDDDIDKIFVEATNACRNFINLETMAHIKGEQGGSFVFAVVSHKQDTEASKIQSQTLSQADLETARGLMKQIRGTGFKDNRTLAAALALMLEEGEIS